MTQNTAYMLGATQAEAEPILPLPADEREAIIEAVRDFAQTELAPHALEWDEQKHFPRDALAAAGALGLGGIYVREDVGGSALSRTRRGRRSSKSSRRPIHRSPPTSRSTTWWRG